MQELYRVPNAAVVFWDQESLIRAHELGIAAVENGELEQIGEGFVLWAG